MTRISSREDSNNDNNTTIPGTTNTSYVSDKNKKKNNKNNNYTRFRKVAFEYFSITSFHAWCDDVKTKVVNVPSFVSSSTFPSTATTATTTSSSSRRRRNATTAKKENLILFLVACIWTISFIGMIEYYNTKIDIQHHHHHHHQQQLTAATITTKSSSSSSSVPVVDISTFVNVTTTRTITTTTTTSTTTNNDDDDDDGELIPKQQLTTITIPEHPHCGAKDEYGNWGYVHDPTALRNNPPKSLQSYYYNNNNNAERPQKQQQQHNQQLHQLCNIHDSNYKMMHDKIRLIGSDDNQQQQQHHKTKRRKSSSKSKSSSIKLFCIVYTTKSSHKTKIPAIRETWGPHCDGFMVASTETNTTLNTVHIPHHGIESYNNIWQKVRSIWSYIYDTYYNYYNTTTSTDDKYDDDDDDNYYDWFHIGGEDMFLIPENLKYYLESDEILQAATPPSPGDDQHSNNNTQQHLQIPLFLGGRMMFRNSNNHQDNSIMFNQGGSGYTINRAALKLLVTEGFPNYYTDEQTFTEDVMIAKVFAKLNVYPYDTRERHNDRNGCGGERYNPYSPGFHYDFRKPHDHQRKKWYASYLLQNDTEYIEGIDHCATYSVSFHYIKADLMYRLYALLYNKCPNIQNQNHRNQK